MRIAIASDHRGVFLKKELIDFFDTNTNHKLLDVGQYTEHEKLDYPDYARLCCERITQGVAEMGILICGTGIGMCMAANKCKGIRTANVDNIDLARLAREHNNANVVCMGSNTLSLPQMTAVINVFIKTEFQRDERHARRVEKMMKLEG